MNTKYFPPVKKWIIPEICFAASLEEMSLDGKFGNEGIALWLGKRSQGNAAVTHLMRLRGSGIIKEPDFLQISPALLNEITGSALNHEVMLLGQIHSHGMYYGVDLSITDKEDGISVPYYLSLVAPDYAMRQHLSLDEYGIHVFEPGFGYRRLHSGEAKAAIEITTSSISILTIGEE